MLPFCGDGVAAGEAVSVGIRPEHVLLDVERADVAFDAKVDQLEQLGAASLLYCSLPSGRIADGPGARSDTPSRGRDRARRAPGSRCSRLQADDRRARIAANRRQGRAPELIPWNRWEQPHSLRATRGRRELRVRIGWQCRLYVLEDDLVRVLFTPPGGLREPRTWTIAAGGDDVPWQGRDRLDVGGFARPAFSIESSDHEVALTTSVLRVVARLRPFGLAWALVDGDALRRRSIDAAVSVEPDERALSGTTWRARAAIATSGSATRPGRSTSTVGACARWHSTRSATTRETSDPLYKHWPYLIVREAGASRLRALLRHARDRHLRSRLRVRQLSRLLPLLRDRRRRSRLLPLRRSGDSRRRSQIRRADRARWPSGRAGAWATPTPR